MPFYDVAEHLRAQQGALTKDERPRRWRKVKDVAPADGPARGAAGEDLDDDEDDVDINEPVEDGAAHAAPVSTSK